MIDDDAGPDVLGGQVGTNDKLELVRLRLAGFRQAQDRLRVALTELREVCPHTRVIEAPFAPNQVFGTLLPLRLCLDCGVEEEGWSDEQFEHLRNPERKVSRSELYAQRMPVGGRVLLHNQFS